jgi:hypothetical protein
MMMLLTGDIAQEDDLNDEGIAEAWLSQSTA